MMEEQLKSAGNMANPDLVGKGLDGGVLMS